ncbi:MAG: glycosyltransferase family 39 protein [Patescibacteria group bacterium]
MIKKDFLIILLLITLTAITRFIFLEKIPTGLHGDEAWLGLWAREIIQNGYIGVFSGDALGNPIGLAYITPIFFKLFGESVSSIRLTVSIFSIGTVSFFYIFLRLFFTKLPSFLTAFAFSFSLIYLHYSRTGFMLTTALFFQIATLVFILIGRNTKKHYLIFIAAVFAGLGMYTYNAFILFPMTIILLLVFDVLSNKFHHIEIKRLILFVFTFIIISLPLLKIVITQPDFYFSHHKTISILNKAEIKDINSFNQKAYLIIQNGFNKINSFFKGDVFDYADGFGDFYSFHLVDLILFGLGSILLFKNLNLSKAFLLFSLIIFLLSSFLTFGGTYRRIILIMPYLYFFAGNAISFLIKQNKLFPILISLVVIISSFINFQTYFFKFPHSPLIKWVYAYDLKETIIKLKSVYVSQSQVLFFSDRWSCNYETIQFLLPNLNCVDRSIEFGNFNLRDSSDKNIYVLMGDYIPYITQIKYLSPKGKEYFVYDDSRLIAIIYQL